MSVLAYEEWLERRDAELLKRHQTEPERQYDFSGWALGCMDTPEEIGAMRALHLKGNTHILFTNDAIEKMNREDREEYRLYVERMSIAN